MEFIHNDTNEQLLSLHDCRADRVTLENGVLSFSFSEGIWVLPEHPENPTGKTVGTGPARVDYVLREQDGDDVQTSVFRRMRWPYALRKRMELPELMAHINEKGGQLEFLYQYPGGWDRILDCWLWPRGRECQFKVDVKEVVYRWNELNTDREW